MTTLTDADIRELDLLGEMYRDAYFPDHLVDRIHALLVGVCREIERTRPSDNDELYVITHAATEQVNDLQDAFDDAGSDLETVARDSISTGFGKVASAYGFDADLEELVAPRDW